MNFSVPNMSLVFMIILLGVILGAVGIYIGELDDAPGLMLIGTLLMIGSTVYGVRLALSRT